MSTAPKKAKLKNAIDDYFCFNPFNKKKHRSSDMRHISDGLVKKFPKNSQICGSCRKQLGKLKELPTLSSNEPCVEAIPDGEENNSENDERTADDDDGCSNFSEGISSKNEYKNQYHKDAVEVLEQIKEKYKTSQCRAERIQLLTLAPSTWSCGKIMTEFGTSQRKARIRKSYSS